MTQINFKSNYGVSPLKANQENIQKEVGRVVACLKPQLKGSKLVFLTRQMVRKHGHCRPGHNSNGYQITINLGIKSEQLIETIIHEVAHALTPRGSDKQAHGKTWQKKYATLLMAWNSQNKTQQVIPSKQVSGHDYDDKVKAIVERRQTRRAKTTK